MGTGRSIGMWMALETTMEMEPLSRCATKGEVELVSPELSSTMRRKVTSIQY